MDTMTHMQYLAEAVCISHSTDNFEKGNNPTILLEIMSKK